MKRLIQIVGGGFLALIALMGMLGGVSILAKFQEHPIVGPLVGGVMAMLGAIAFAGCMRLVLNSPSSGGMFAPLELRVFAVVFLLLPIGGLFTGYFRQHPLLGTIQALAYFSIFGSLWRIARTRQPADKPESGV